MDEYIFGIKDIETNAAARIALIIEQVTGISWSVGKTIERYGYLPPNTVILYRELENENGNRLQPPKFIRVVKAPGEIQRLQDCNIKKLSEKLEKLSVIMKFKNVKTW